MFCVKQVLKPHKLWTIWSNNQGGHQHIGFTQKDMYNHVDAMRRIEIKDGDVEVVLAYLCGKAEMDSSFFL